MPITIPIVGSEASPSSEILHSASASIDIRSFAGYEAGSSVDITSNRSIEAEESITIAKMTLQDSSQSIGIGYEDTIDVARAIEVMKGDSFLILADVLEAGLAGGVGGSYGSQEINARLTVNGDEVAIRAFSFQVPTGRLGSILNITLADPTVEQIPAGADILFQLVVQTDSGEAKFDLIRDGKLQEREYTITYQGGQIAGPKDQVTFGALDVMADRFTLAPRRPVIMFDPSRVKFDDINTKASDLVRNEDGSGIYPVIEPVYGLTMSQILSRAYTGRGGTSFISANSTSLFTSNPSWGLYTGADQEGCGFARVITNISDYRVRRADFTLESGWHDGALPVVAMYAPVYFTNGNDLFILDPDKPLLPGMISHNVTLRDHKILSERIAYKADQNAVLLTYQYAANDPTEDAQRATREVFSEEEQISITDVPADGTYDGYRSTTTITTRRWTIETYLPTSPTEVLDSYPKSSNVETRTTVVWPVAGSDVTPAFRYIQEGVLVHKETAEYQYYNELKIGHQREIQGAVKLPDNSIGLLTVEREETEISWTDDPSRPGVKLQDKLVTRITGAVYHDSDSDEVIILDGVDNTVTRQVPVLASQASGVISSTSVLSTSVPIKTIRETLRNMNGNQFDIETLEIDHLNNTVNRSRATPVTGGVSTDPYSTRSRNVLFRNIASENEIGPRTPVPVNAYELPREQAFDLARRVRYRLSNPLMELPLSLPGVDFALDRGSVIQGQKRSPDGYTGDYLVTGYSITGSNLGRQGHRIAENVEAVELSPLEES